VAIFSENELVTRLKYKLDNRCSNNQVEQLAITKALEALETTDIEENSPRTAAIITDRRIFLDSIKNVNNHSYLIEKIRERLSKLERSNWTVAFAWVKVHAGIIGNELAEQLDKTAARVTDKTTSYSRIHFSTLFRELEEESKIKKQQNWEECPNAIQISQVWCQDTVKPEPTYTNSNYCKVQHVLATREIRLGTTCYTIAPYFNNKGKYSIRIH